MKNWFKKMGLAEAVILGSIIIAFGLFLVLGVMGGFANAGAWKLLIYYSSSLKIFFVDFFYGSLILLCITTILFVTWALLKNFLSLFIPAFRRWDIIDKGKSPVEVILGTLTQLQEILIIIPALFFILLVSLGLGEANAIDKTRLQDNLVISWEHWLTGNYVFAALGSVHYPDWFLKIVISSFNGMSFAIIVSGIIIGIINSKVLREMIVAFCVGTLITVPLWLIFPALSPQDRFIDNSYHLSISPQMALVVSGYHPQAEIENFLNSVRTSKENLPSLPTTTMPSAHIFWAAITGYYLFRAKKWLGWIALPFLLASSFGTVLLAQHYLTDIPVSLACAALAIWAAGYVADREQKAGSAEAIELK